MPVYMDILVRMLYDEGIVYPKEGETGMLEYKFDTQLLIEGENLSEDDIHDYITAHFKGDCLLAVGDDTLIKIHYHTNEPWDVLAYGASLVTSSMSSWKTWNGRKTA